jgi:hypothetical protein
VPLRKTPKTLIPQTDPRTLGPASAGLFLVRASSVPAIVLRQHHTQPFSCEDEEPRPNSALGGSGPGRPKGVQNRATREIKAALLEAAENVGDEKAMDAATAAAKAVASGCGHPFHHLAVGGRPAWRFPSPTGAKHQKFPFNAGFLHRGALNLDEPGTRRAKVPSDPSLNEARRRVFSRRSAADKFAAARHPVRAGEVAERGTVISFTGGEQVYIVVNEQPQEIIKPNL